MSSLSFFERMGIDEVEKPFLLREISESLRIALSNVLLRYLFEPHRPARDFLKRSETINTLSSDLIVDLWNVPLERKPIVYSEFVKMVTIYVRDASWSDVFHLLEFIIQNKAINDVRKVVLINKINCALEKENSAYRFVNGLVQEITNENEISEIEKAIEDNPYKHCKAHLEQALKLMSDRENPDYRNSIKESISAVETIVKSIVGDEKAKLGTALAKLEKKHEDFHPSYKEAFRKLYGWTSDGDGIRHALMQESNLTLADARFMLIACSAFVNYLKDLNKD